MKNTFTSPFVHVLSSIGFFIFSFCLILLPVSPQTASGKASAVQPKAPPLAKPFNLHDVRLLDGPFKQGQDRAVDYLLEIEPDRLLANFRKEAGLEPKAEHYRGWEAQEISGHTLGHYLSACSLAWASTADRRFLDRVNYIVNELALCQETHGNGYVAAIPDGKRIFAEIAAGNIRSSGFDLNGLWVPNYNLHKTFAGLRDAYRLAHNYQALKVEKKLADWFDKTHENLSEEQIQKLLAAEHGGLNETFADLYADTGDVRYLALSKKIHHKAILDPLSEGKDILPGKHGNTQIPKIIGLARRYELTGDQNDRTTADYFWNRVVHHHSYVTGGHSDHEYFGPPDQLNDRLSTNTAETCNVYNMLKLTTHVFGWKPNAKTADFYERALLNHIRASQHPDGRVMYYLSLFPGHHKDYQSKFNSFTCCVGSGMENHVKYGEAIYFHDEDGIWVNLFISSEVQWKDKNVTLRQETHFPESDTTQFSILTDAPQPFSLRIRHPVWATQGIQVKVNGIELPLDTDPSGYAPIEREWQSGDKVVVTFPMNLRTESMPDNPNRIAVFYGPTLLAADLAPADKPIPDPNSIVPVLLIENQTVSDWIKPDPHANLRFHTVGVAKPQDISFAPFYSLHDRRYSVYLDRYTQAEWQARQENIRTEQQRRRELESKTVDFFQPGEMQPERDHNLNSERSGAGEAFGRRWRHAVNGGWFSFEMKVNNHTFSSNEKIKLVCTYWGGDSGGRIFDILVDDQKIAEQRLQNNHPNRFFDEVYEIPQELIEGKETITVKLQAHPGKTAGGLFGARLIKE